MGSYLAVDGWKCVPTEPYGAASLRDLYGQPSKRALEKQLDHLDRHCRHFISLSPFIVIATADAHGRADASPKGDAPGFVRVENERTLLIPDRIGNKRIDSLTNLTSNPRLGLIFMIPGVAETLRVNGKAEITRDPTLLNSLAAMGKAPKTAIRVTVEEAYLHCGKSIIRAKLWDPEQRVERSTLPSLGRMIADQIEGIDADESDAHIERNYREELY